MTPEQAQAIVDAAVALVIWRNKVPLPKNAYEREEELDDALHAAVCATIPNDEWWALTWAKDGWPEDKA